MREEMEDRAKARREGFTSHNNKYGVGAEAYLSDADTFSLNNNPRHQAIAAVREQIRNVEEEAARVEEEVKRDDDAEESPTETVVAIGPTTDAPDLEQRCRAINANIRESSLEATRISLDERQIVNTARFSVEPDDSTGGSRAPANNAGASRSAKKGR